MCTNVVLAAIGSYGVGRGSLIVHGQQPSERCFRTRFWCQWSKDIENRIHSPSITWYIAEHTILPSLSLPIMWPCRRMWRNGERTMFPYPLLRSCDSGLYNNTRTVIESVGFQHSTMVTALLNLHKCEILHVRKLQWSKYLKKMNRDVGMAVPKSKGPSWAVFRQSCCGLDNDILP